MFTGQQSECWYALLRLPTPDSRHPGSGESARPAPNSLESGEAEKEALTRAAIGRAAAGSGVREAAAKDRAHGGRIGASGASRQWTKFNSQLGHIVSFSQLGHIVSFRKGEPCILILCGISQTSSSPLSRDHKSYVNHINQTNRPHSIHTRNKCFGSRPARWCRHRDHNMLSRRARNKNHSRDIRRTLASIRRALVFPPASEDLETRCAVP
jgi:hypothetical protein